MFALAFDGQKQGMLFLMLLYTGVVCAFSLARLVRIRQWPSVEGVLHARGSRAVGVDPQPGRREFVPWAHYEYRVDGQAYQGHRVSAWQFSGSGLAAGLPARLSARIPVHGDAVRVYYDPRRPTRSYVLRPGWTGMLFLVALMVLPAVLYAWHYHGR